MKRSYSFAIAGAFLGAVMLSPATSRADAFGREDVHAVASPVVTSGSSAVPGWIEYVVEIDNQASSVVSGTIDITSSRGEQDRGAFRVDERFEIAANSTRSFRLPVSVRPYEEVEVNVTDKAGESIPTRLWTGTSRSGSGAREEPRARTVLDMTGGGQIQLALMNARIEDELSPSNTAKGPVVVMRPTWLASGETVVPDYSKAYSQAELVVVRPELLDRLKGAELEALQGYVLGGGSLAVAGDDRARANLDAFRGVTFDSSPFGKTATYGLGEVHLLGFGLGTTGDDSDGRLQRQMISLLRRARARRDSAVFEDFSSEYYAGAALRRQLDPNENSHWAIAAAAILLCVYAVIAGPFNFSRAARKRKPLRGLLRLPLFAAGCFALIVAIGIAAKGFVGRARHIAFFDAGAGMKKAAATRFRGFFASEKGEISIRASDKSSLVDVPPMAEREDPRRNVVLDTEGAQLVGVPTKPWQTVVVRDEGIASLGEGISITKVDGDVKVTNRTQRALLDVLVRVPSSSSGRLGEIVQIPRIDAGRSALVSTGKSLASTPEGAATIARIAEEENLKRTPGYRSFNINQLFREMGSSKPDVIDGWAAIESEAGAWVDWLPAGEPVLLASFEGGEGISKDSGFRVESDRAFVRVVGYGGTP